MTSDRIRRYEVCADIFPLMFQTGIVIEVVKGLPSDCKLRGYVICPDRNILILFIEHESFDLVKKDMYAPTGERFELRRIDEEIHPTP